ncbi:hypothetical protein GCM10009592_28810 [Brachybacterium rhamnosum]
MARAWVAVPMKVAGTLHVRLAAPGLVELSLRNGQPGATGTVVLGTLPVGYRPSRPLDVAATSGVLRITQDGTVSLVSVTQATAWQYVAHVYTTDEEVA